MGVQQYRSTTVPKIAGKFQNHLNAFSKERETTDANEQRKQNCSYQGEVLNVPTTSQGLWSSNNMKKLNAINKNEFILN